MSYGVAGHEANIQGVLNSLRLPGRVRSFLFFGDAHIGKATSAAVIARVLEHGHVSSPMTLSDALVIKASDGESIGIDRVREVVSFLHLTPLRSVRRLVVVDDAECLTAQAQAALLKVLEEPPSFGALILVTQASEALIAPLRSRLLKTYFRRLSRKELADFICGNSSLSREAALDLAARSFGCPGRALNLLKKKDEAGNEDFALKILEVILELYHSDRRANATRIARLLRALECAESANVNQAIVRKLLGLGVS